MPDSEIEFFPQESIEEFFGGHISFTQGCTGTWALGQKLNERHDQSTKEEFEAYGAPSAAYGTFECFNVDGPGEIAIMKISMQIPYAGPTFQSARTRARQTSNQLTSYTRSELKRAKS
ncbi:hypothetical protein ASPWEDRAFT_167362 [Aspergillus wentii DTO 134E9]|uniref:Uncharacterized protein n=1 Tax=Aspergillus wentii DTO 134E9 TaxID=1073089 RepID=A0A1L9S2F5_ASPWE|nr:uncharacterized protein ASPWEDRAFT_167362 [Aspergillus wentii DTO 134E9]KAI9924386.1 hypothetical protein MW887_007012 [Aspergillus wentii]OJJ41341.1 hypothetical protein ASPWEDRAFT_167362 [Aspergillus wentii DTO 134E9]